MNQTSHTIIGIILSIISNAIIHKYFGYIYKDHIITKYGERHAKKLSQWIDNFLSKLI